MYQLFFPNGNVQSYNSESQLSAAVRAFGGECVRLGSGAKEFAFVPKK